MKHFRFLILLLLFLFFSILLTGHIEKKSKSKFDFKITEPQSEYYWETGVIQNLFIQIDFYNLAFSSSSSPQEVLQGELRPEEIFRKINRSLVQNTFLGISIFFWLMLIVLSMIKNYKNEMYIKKLNTILLYTSFCFIFISLFSYYINETKNNYFGSKQNTFLFYFKWFLLNSLLLDFILNILALFKFHHFLKIYFYLPITKRIFSLTDKIKFNNFNNPEKENKKKQMFDTKLEKENLIKNISLIYYSSIAKGSFFFKKYFSFIISLILIVICSTLLTNIFLYPIYKLQILLPKHFTYFLLVLFLFFIFYYIYAYKVELTKKEEEASFLDSFGFLSYQVMRKIILFFGFLFFLILIISLIITVAIYNINILK